jgi:hypothetical protein
VLIDAHLRYIRSHSDQGPPLKRKKTGVSSRAGKNKNDGKKPIEQYEHKDKKRANIPPVGLVTPETDPIAPERGKPPAKQYQYDPHLDPQLVWAGKAVETFVHSDRLSITPNLFAISSSIVTGSRAPELTKSPLSIIR